MVPMSDDTLEDVEDALSTILQEAITADLGTAEVVAIEHSCQSIHAKFGGESPDDIYPDGGG